MAKVTTAHLVCTPPADATAIKIREEPNYDAPAVRFPLPSPLPAEARIPVSGIPFLAGKEGIVTAFITGADDADNESDFVEVTGPLDLSPPSAPANARFEQP